MIHESNSVYFRVRKGIVGSLDVGRNRRAEEHVRRRRGVGVVLWGVSEAPDNLHTYHVIYGAGGE